jgi:hypothetical protein
METFVQNLIYSSGDMTGYVCKLFGEILAAVQSDLPLLGGIGTGIAFAAAGGGMNNNIPAEILAVVRRWRGKMDDQYANICNVADMLSAHQTEWGVPQDLVDQLVRDRDRLGTLIIKSRSSTGSSADRMIRNTLLKNLVSQCTTRIKTWAVAQYYAGVLTADDVLLLGFLLPGDAKGHHDRKEPTDELTEVKVSVINSDYIRVIIDRSDVENAALVRHGWPDGVQMAQIVILADDGVTEVFRQMTTHLHTDIQMPAGSRGKQFIIKAAFLRHVDDAPRFGN